MPPNCFIATLAQSQAANGSETEVFLSTIKTLTGETVTTSQFSTLGRGILTVDPLSSTGIEFQSFTAVDASGIGFTGLTRGLSALSNSSLSANKKYHPAGTQVIIAFGVHNLLDLQTYITSAVSGSLGTATDTTAGSTKMSFNMGSLPRAKIALVSQSASGATNLLVNPFSFEYQMGVFGNLPTTANPPVLSAVTSGAFTAPTVNPRIDLVVWTTSAAPGAVAIRQGTEGASPTAPAPTNGDIVLCSVFNRVGQTKVLERNDSINGYIIQWYEPTVYTTSTPLVSTQVSAGTDQSQATTNGTVAVGESNVTTKKSILAQSFVSTVSGIQGFKLWKIADTGTFTGTVKVALQADSSGSPSGSDLASYTISNAAWLKLNGAAEFAVSFSTEYESISVGSTYWLVVAPSTSDTSNHPNLGINTAGGYAAGSLKFNNSADGWVTIATSDLYFKTTAGVLSKIVQTDSASGLVPQNIRPYSLVAMDTNTVSNSTTTETTAYSIQLEGGFWTLNSGIKLTAYTNFLGAGATIAWKVKYNGSVIGTFSTTSSNTVAGTMTFYIVNQASLSSQKYAVSYLAFSPNKDTNSTSANPIAISTYSQVGAGTSTVDLSQPGLLEYTIQTSSTGSSQAVTNSFTLIEKIG